MGQIYEGMFLIDNDVVRQGWRSAKSIVTDTLQKHGAKIHTARRWDERRLAYPIEGRVRATYFLAYFEMPSGQFESLRRDMDLNDKVLRYLQLAVEQVPADEAAKALAEDDADYIVPEPPADDEPDFEEPVASDEPGDDEEGSEESSDEDAESEATAEAAASKES